ncbi:Hypothetical predicted protein [Mytilus galloprovincialis]|uniref:Uncharacterized protein n=1 Tax=Mytilus galloprovincialis TaxID=29158 RepID=A0A8B6FBK9_MYTGA|nr:Hypothetical predicted protein [Mytilus galloprovincialis]
MTIGCFITGGLLFVSLVVFYSAVRDLASKENANISYSFWMTCIASTLYILNGFTFVFAILTGKSTIGRKNTEKDIDAALLQLSRLLKSSTGTIERQTTKASKEEEIGAALLHLSCLLRSRTDTIRRQNAKATIEDEIDATMQRVSCLLMSMTDTIESQTIKATKEKEIVAAML